MPAFPADRLPGVLFAYSMVCTELGSAKIDHRWRRSIRRRFISHLRVPMPQSVKRYSGLHAALKDAGRQAFGSRAL